MSELDHIPIATTMGKPSKLLTTTVSVSSKTTSARVTRASAAQQRTKLIKIAPAPPNKTTNISSSVQAPLTREKTRRKMYNSDM